MLNALDKLISWLRQMAQRPRPYKNRKGDNYPGFLYDEIRSLDTTIAEVQNWMPPAPSRKVRKNKS